jgi:hypothetical protein
LSTERSSTDFTDYTDENSEMSVRTGPGGGDAAGEARETDKTNGRRSQRRLFCHPWNPRNPWTKTLQDRVIYDGA